MTISNNGCVGIGANITTPLAKLHVDQSIIAEGNITTFDKFVLAPNNANSNRWEISRTNNGLNYAYSNNSNIKNVLFIGNNGNIGIGKTDPSVALDVNGTAKAANATITGATNTNSLKVTQNAIIDGKTTTNSLKVTQNAIIDSTLTANLLKAAKLQITSLICAKEVKVQNDLCWPDYVFNKDYKLQPLNELEQFITENQHLPNVPSAADVEENGVELGEMNALLLQKVEELTLYILDLQKQINELKNNK
jgi:hypothetical protein